MGTICARIGCEADCIARTKSRVSRSFRSNRLTSLTPSSLTDLYRGATWKTAPRQPFVALPSGVPAVAVFVIYTCRGPKGDQHEDGRGVGLLSDSRSGNSTDVCVRTLSHPA